jgi:hypothetical protein
MDAMTAQAPEKIKYEGIDLPLLCEPGFPASHPRIQRVPEEQARASNRECFSTACWRNYIGEWEVRRGRLYLAGVSGLHRITPGPALEATWFSGVLRMPTGGLLHFQHAGYASMYRSEFFAEVEGGVVVRTWNESNSDEELE